MAVGVSVLTKEQWKQIWSQVTGKDRRMMGRVEEGGFEDGGVSKEIKIGFRVLINY